MRAEGLQPIAWGGEFEHANIGQASVAATVMLGSVLAIVAPYLHFELSRKDR